MTNEQMDKIDALVAEHVMGWMVHPRNTAHWMKKHDEGNCGYKVMGFTSGHDHWSPTRDGNEMLKVLGKLTNEYPLLEIDRDGGEWWVDLDPRCHIQGRADTMPLAVALAAIKAKGVSVP